MREAYVFQPSSYQSFTQRLFNLDSLPHPICTKHTHMYTRKHARTYTQTDTRTHVFTYTHMHPTFLNVQSHSLRATQNGSLYIRRLNFDAGRITDICSMSMSLKGKYLNYKGDYFRQAFHNVPQQNFRACSPSWLAWCIGLKAMYSMIQRFLWKPSPSIHRNTRY